MLLLCKSVNEVLNNEWVTYLSPSHRKAALVGSTVLFTKRPLVFNSHQLLYLLLHQSSSLQQTPSISQFGRVKFNFPNGFLWPIRIAHDKIFYFFLFATNNKLISFTNPTVWLHRTYTKLYQVYHWIEKKSVANKREKINTKCTRANYNKMKCNLLNQQTKNKNETKSNRKLKWKKALFGYSGSSRLIPLVRCKWKGRGKKAEIKWSSSLNSMQFSSSLR